MSNSGVMADVTRINPGFEPADVKKLEAIAKVLSKKLKIKINRTQALRYLVRDFSIPALKDESTPETSAARTA